MICASHDGLQTEISCVEMPLKNSFPETLKT